jgi:hypothetical protein
MSNAPVAKVYHVPSDSNPSKRWEVLERTDGFLSCSCPVWVFNKRKTEPRSCKHTEQVKSGFISATTVYQETTVEQTRRAEKVVERQREDAIDRNARLNFPTANINAGRATRRNHPVVNSAEESSQVSSNARKLAAIKERLSKEGNMEVFPTHRKVNW